MPSYRVIMTIGPLRPGTAPHEVLPAAADAVAEVALLEASSVNVVRGAARITVRFTVEDDEVAVQVGEHAVSVTEERAAVEDTRLTRQSRGRWTTVATR
ncbi:MAG: hypothetical protein JWR33_1321 [Naasia sp.]|uniref:hypothetical protein n=1 Tax=Naasia sp. TaxID=2546198 RepID=UPI00260CEA84|nr:hypothetical protein [Naasia sp.]MCU1570580.1 hypothetical protein [Naasia sp.]